MKYLIVFALLCGSLQAEKLVILGGGPAGLTAAIYAARAGLSPLVIEGLEPGGQIALTHMVDNFPGFPDGIFGPELIQNMHEQAARFDARFVSDSVTQVDFTTRPFVIYTDETTILADTVIIATGASAKWLNLPSEQALLGRGVSSCAVCDGVAYKGEEVVVIGGGDTALEDALFLANHASKVTVIHRRDRLRASHILQEKAFTHPKIQFAWNSKVLEVLDTSNVVAGVKIIDLITQRTSEIACSGVFIAIGHTPNTDAFRGQLAMDSAGYLLHQSHSTSTDIPGVFVAGDVADHHYRQAITAAGMGCQAAMDAYHYIRYSPTQ